MHFQPNYPKYLHVKIEIKTNAAFWTEFKATYWIYVAGFWHELDLVKNKDQEYFCQCRTRFLGGLCNPSLPSHFVYLECSVLFRIWKYVQGKVAVLHLFFSLSQGKLHYSTEFRGCNAPLGALKLNNFHYLPMLKWGK